MEGLRSEVRIVVIGKRRNFNILSLSAGAADLLE